MTVEELIQKLAQVPSDYSVELEVDDDGETRDYQASSIEVSEFAQTVKIV